MMPIVKKVCATCSSILLGFSVLVFTNCSSDSDSPSQPNNFSTYMLTPSPLDNTPIYSDPITIKSVDLQGDIITLNLEYRGSREHAIQLFEKPLFTEDNNQPYKYLVLSHQTAGDTGTSLQKTPISFSVESIVKEFNDVYSWEAPLLDLGVKIVNGKSELVDGKSVFVIPH